MAGDSTVARQQPQWYPFEAVEIQAEGGVHGERGDRILPEEDCDGDLLDR